MLNADQAESLRAAVKAAPKGDPIHVAYHAGDGKNQHDQYRTVLADKETVVLGDGGKVIRVCLAGEPLFDKDGVEVQEFAESTFTDASGDLDALVEYFNAPSEVMVWARLSLPDLKRELRKHVGKLDSAALADFLALADVIVDFGDADVRAALETIVGQGAALVALLQLGQVPASRCQALCLLPEDGSGARTTTAPGVRVSREDVSDALYEQRGSTVAKR